MPRLQDAVPGDPQRTWQRHPNPVLIDPLHLAPKSTDRRHATSILERPIQGRREPHQTVGPKACDAGLAGTLDHAARHDLLGAVGGSCGEAVAIGFHAGAAYPDQKTWPPGGVAVCFGDPRCENLRRRESSSSKPHPQPTPQNSPSPYGNLWHTEGESRTMDGTISSTTTTRFRSTMADWHQAWSRDLLVRATTAPMRSATPMPNSRSATKSA